MKKIMLSVCCILNFAVYAQIGFVWAKSAGGTSDDLGKSCTTDASGNIIATGSFMSPSITFGTTTLTNADTTGNTYDFFIVKYDANGNVLWAKSTGGTADDYGQSCTTDASGNIIATGFFWSSSITFGTTTLTNASADTSDFFIVKYDQSGNVLWAKRAGGTSWDEGLSCSADASGNIIATGYFGSSSITFGTTTLTNAGLFGDIFIVKYDPSGNVLWAKSAGGTYGDYGLSCSTDASGNIIATGYFLSSSITFGTTTLSDAGSEDIFIVKYDANGNVLWAKSAGGNSDDVGYSCSADASGNIIATGYFFSSSITFGTTTLTNAVPANYSDIFIVKYDPNGNVLWAKSEGGTSWDMGYSCTADASGNIIATGYFYSSSITFGTTTLTNAGSDDIFIVKYDPSGNVLWAKRAGGTGDDDGRSCSADASGNIIATGLFASSSITFGTTTLTNATGYTDMFIVKLDGATGIEENNFENGVSVFPNPSSGIFSVDLRNCRDARLSVCDVLGNCLLEKNCRSETSQEINLSCQPKGIYFVELLSGGERVVKKVAIQ